MWFTVRAHRHGSRGLALPIIPTTETTNKRLSWFCTCSSLVRWVEDSDTWRKIATKLVYWWEVGLHTEIQAYSYDAKVVTIHLFSKTFPACNFPSFSHVQAMTNSTALWLCGFRAKKIQKSSSNTASSEKLHLNDETDTFVMGSSIWSCVWAMLRGPFTIRTTWLFLIPPIFYG